MISRPLVKQELNDLRAKTIFLLSKTAKKLPHVPMKEEFECYYDPSLKGWVLNKEPDTKSLISFVGSLFKYSLTRIYMTRYI